MCVSKDATYSITTYVVGAEKPDESCDVLESEDNGFGLDQVPPSPNTAPLFMRSVETQPFLRASDAPAPGGQEKSISLHEDLGRKRKMIKIKFTPLTLLIKGSKKPKSGNQFFLVVH